jgi:hypothetical protein
VVAGQLSRKELDELVGKQHTIGVGLWIDLVRVPPAGTWARRRADLFAAAEDWIGPQPEMTPAAAASQLVRSYLAGFGPASTCRRGTRRCLSTPAVHGSCPRSTGRRSSTSATRTPRRRSSSTARWPGRGSTATGRSSCTRFTKLDRATQRELRAEADRLATFHA